MQMRTAIALAIVVGIGLIWSVAAISKLVPVPSEELSSSNIAVCGHGRAA